jgi:purine-binding chemotaxis protein CheW
MKVLSFTLGQHPYGVSIAPVREIIGVGDITPVPLTPGFLCGVINLRGSVVPVLDLAVRLGLPRSERTERSCILVVEAGQEPGGPPQFMGLLVDAVHEVLRLDDASLADVPGFGTRVDPAFVAGVHATPGSSLLLLALERVLSMDDLTQAIETGLAEPEWA